MKSEKIAKLAARANKRMAQLEKNNALSPAYKSAQSRLEMLGARNNKNTGRRFKESGNFKSKKEAEQYENILKNFMNQDTSTLKGYKEYRNQVIESARERFQYADFGISDDEYLKIWESLPDDENERVFGSDTVIAIIEVMSVKQKNIKRENQLTIEEIVEKIQSAKTVKGALKKLGITISEYAEISSMGEL